MKIGFSKSSWLANQKDTKVIDYKQRPTVGTPSYRREEWVQRRVVGVDRTTFQRHNAQRLRSEGRKGEVQKIKMYIENGLVYTEIGGPASRIERQ